MFPVQNFTTEILPFGTALTRMRTDGQYDITKPLWMRTHTRQSRLYDD